MCDLYHRVRVYDCGDAIPEVAKFEPCKDPFQENHKLERRLLTTVMDEAKCGRYDCIDPPGKEAEEDEEDSV